MNKHVTYISYKDAGITIVEDNTDEVIYRTNFTIAHEIGHIVLHQNILKQYYKATSDTQTIKPSDSVISKLEMQANTFASALLLPKDVFLIETARRMSQLDIRPPLFKDYQRVNLRDCHRFCAYLQSFLTNKPNYLSDFSILVQIICRI